MNDVNFLPQSFRERRKKSRRTLRQGGLIAVVAGVLCAWGVMLHTDGKRQDRLAEELETAMLNERAKIEAMVAMDAEYATLSRQAELNRALDQPVTYTRVLESLGELMPTEVSLVELTLVSVRPEPEPAQSAGKSKPARTAKSEDRPSDLIEVELEALAPSDLSVARLVSSLDDHALFSKVKMRSSRSVEQDNLILRRFRLTAVVDLDREFDWKPTRQEVADAH